MRQSHWTAVAWLVGSALVGCLGCGGSDEPAAAQPQVTEDAGADHAADIGNGDEDASAPDTGIDAPEDAAQEAAADVQDEPSGPLTTNPIIVTTGVFGGGANTNITIMATTSDEGERCFIGKVGTCYYYDCRAKSAIDPEPDWISGGTITLKKGSDVLIESVPNADGSYPTASENGELWSPGDDISLTTAGDEIPSFTQALVAPSAAVLLSPTPGSDGKVAIDRSQPLTITWEPQAGGVTLTCNQTEGTGGFARQARFLCEFDGNAGTAVIPVEALSVLRTSDQSPTTNFVFGGNATADLEPGGYQVHVHSMYANHVQANVTSGM